MNRTRGHFSSHSLAFMVSSCNDVLEAFVNSKFTCFYRLAILVMIGCVLAYKTRNLDPRFGEAKQLGFAMYNIAFTGIIIIIISGVVHMDQVNKKMLQTVGVLWGTLFCSSGFRGSPSF